MRRAQSCFHETLGLGESWHSNTPNAQDLVLAEQSLVVVVRGQRTVSAQHISVRSSHIRSLRVATASLKSRNSAENAVSPLIPPPMVGGQLQFALSEADPRNDQIKSEIVPLGRNLTGIAEALRP